MTKTLTEQWREGTLQLGTYYIVNKNGDEEIDRSVAVGELWNNTDLKEVIAPVPSYDHFSQLVKKVEQLQEQLTIAIKALKGVSLWANTGNGGEKAVKKVCEKALKEMEGVK